MRIYTKTGDLGQTSLIGGKRVPKYHERIEAYGTVDELISCIGLLRDLNDNDLYKKLLLHIQDRLMTAASLLAAGSIKFQKDLPKLGSEDIEFLEKEMDLMDAKLPELRSFLLPGGHPVVSCCHMARTICRRAERITVRLSRLSPHDRLIIKYLNRLSDFLFVFSRLISNELGVDEIQWKPKL